MSSTPPPAGPRATPAPDDADRFDLQRFVQAQSANFEEALAELRAGSKRTHWSWYVLPQLRGLGTSALSVRYAISGLEEARAYLAHPVLGPRLRDCLSAINGHAGQRAVADILGPVDAQKLHACATLFSMVAELGSVFQRTLILHFHGQSHARTVMLLSRLS